MMAATTTRTTSKLAVEDMLLRTDISWKAKGLAAAIALMADKFKHPGLGKVSILVQHGSEQETSIRNGLRELEAAGILTMTRLRNAEGSGHVTGSTWEIDVEWTKC